MIFILFLLTLLSHSTSNASVLDFCVADLSSPQTPSGYPCKSSVTIKDFVFSNFNEGNSTNFFKFSVTPAFVNQFPAVNGLGISAARLDLDIGGVLPMHSHRGATELMIVVQGRITAGFISSDNKVFVATLSKGEVLVFPQGLLHFQFNAGKSKASAFLTFSSSNPGSQVVDLALFGNKLSSAFVEKTTLLDHAQVRKLKAIFGGSG
ncbi:auxin-binding protein ABP19b-like [Vicia villosa]|uniref:auxin-binding protein ABP19b-like n=1 Tax=Vicia villosa TaxID=3911 RepID=UPI00273A7981|nr:auxin-binding protein ABP19b-like [Vicia villosa]